jgi:hypothetical protein
MTDMLTRDQVAERLGIQPNTLSSLVTRGRAPKPDGHVGRTPWWSPATIDAHLAARAERHRQLAEKAEARR